MVKVLIWYIMRLDGREIGIKLHVNRCIVNDFVSKEFGSDGYM
jgi:hypothetical protein